MSINDEEITLTVDEGSPYYYGARAYVTQTSSGAVITITDKQGTTTATAHNGENGEKGDTGVAGQDGVSPIVSVEDIEGGHEISITDAEGTTTFNVMDGVDGQDGADGQDGQDGQDGADGVSPTVSVEAISGGHEVSITDAEGTTTFNVMDGEVTEAYLEEALADVKSDLNKTNDNIEEYLLVDPVLFDEASITVPLTGSGKWITKKVYEITSFAVGDTYTFTMGSVTGATNVNPISVYLYKSGNTEIRHISRNASIQVTVEQSDIDAGLVSIGFLLCPAQNTAMTSDAVYSNVRLIKGTSPDISYAENLEQYVDGRITTQLNNTGFSDVISDFQNSGLVIDCGTLTSGKFVKYSDGGLRDNANYLSTDYIGIKGVAQIGVICAFDYEAGVAFYDANKVYISGVGKGNSALGDLVIMQVPINAYYFRTCYYPSSGYDCKVIIDDIKVSLARLADAQNLTNPCDYNGNEISVFDKILCVGDSLTKGTFNYREGGTTNHYLEDVKYSYPTILKKITGIETTNKGRGGYTSVQWYTAEASSDLSGYDMAIIQLGVNDVGTYGTWGQDSIDAFTSIINKLKTQNNNIKIFVANIIPATSYQSSSYLTFSSAMLSWLETTYASDANVIPLDMQQYGHTADDAAYNCGHLSALGYSRLAQDYKAYISYYISKHMSDFSEVQFIGTNYQYRA